MFPQMEVVGVSINVISLQSKLQSVEIFFTISSGGNLSTSSTTDVFLLLSLYLISLQK